MEEPAMVPTVIAHQGSKELVVSIWSPVVHLTAQNQTFVSEANAFVQRAFTASHHALKIRVKTVEFANTKMTIVFVNALPDSMVSLSITCFEINLIYEINRNVLRNEYLRVLPIAEGFQSLSSRCMR